MDIQTLTIVTCVTAATTAAALGAMVRFCPSDACARDWAGSGLLFFANSALGMLTLLTVLPPWVVVLANACTVAGYGLVVTGLRQYLGQSSGRRWVWGLSAVVLALNALPAVQESLPLRLLVGWPVIALCCFWGSALALGAPATRRSWLLVGVGVWLALYGSQQALRVGLLLRAHIGGTPLDWGSPLMTAGRLLFFVFILVTAVLCALLVLQDKVRALQSGADLDPLTGWFNRRAMHRVLDAEWARARRQGSPLQLLVFDIDHFKAVNDRYGHAVGDQALQHVTQAVSQALRGYDQRFRMGGEEFVVCVPGEQGAQLAERVRARVASVPLWVAGESIPLTVSIGGGALRASDAGWEAVLQRADQRLYAAKQAGRNRVVWESEGFSG